MAAISHTINKFCSHIHVDQEVLISMPADNEGVSVFQHISSSQYIDVAPGSQANVRGSQPNVADDEELQLIGVGYEIGPDGATTLHTEENILVTGVGG